MAVEGFGSPGRSPFAAHRLILAARNEPRSRALRPPGTPYASPMAERSRGDRTGQAEEHARALIEPRLFSPDQAARYLGLGSRWAIYRLIARGTLPALRLAGKLRLDRADLDAFIDRAKTAGVAPPGPRAATARCARPAPRQLAPLEPARPRRTSGPRRAASPDLHE